MIILMRKLNALQGKSVTQEENIEMPWSIETETLKSDRPLFRIIGDMGIVAVMPVILYLKAANIPPKRYRRCIQILDSYLVRRFLYGRITQGLTTFLISLLEHMERNRPTHYEETMAEHLNTQTSDGLIWPNDRILVARLTDSRLGGTVQRRKMILVELERHLRKERMAEPLGQTKRLTIEHVMPRQWQTHWGLPGSASLEMRERREERVHALGNLTLTTDRLNSSLSNGPWEEKRTALDNHSTLLLNKDLLYTCVDWDEDAIDRRGEILASRIIDIWKPAQYFLDNRL